MALQHFTYTVGTTPQLLFTAPGAGRRKVYIENRSATNAVNIGDATITNADGYQITAQAATGVSNRLEIEVFGGDQIWASAVAGTAVVTVLVPGY